MNYRLCGLTRVNGRMDRAAYNDVVGPIPNRGGRCGNPLLIAQGRARRPHTGRHN